MYYLTKIFKIPIGHRLSKHSGLCFNIHGHTISVEIKLMAKNLNKNNMVIDFHTFKKIANIIFINDFDHCLLLNDQDKHEIEHCDKYSRKTFIFHNADPTAETISKYIFEEFNKYFEIETDDIRCYSVKVWESDTANCKYIDHDYIINFVKSFMDDTNYDNKLPDKIELVHKKNFELIKKYNIEVGDVFILKANREYTETISHIHSLYGWMTTGTDRQKLPQEVEEAFKSYDHCKHIVTI